MQHHIDSGSYAGTRQTLAVFDIEAILFDTGEWCESGEIGDASMVRGAIVPIKEPGAGGKERTGTDRRCRAAAHAAAPGRTRQSSSSVPRVLSCGDPLRVSGKRFFYRCDYAADAVSP
jgi:hypothetical protein